MSHASVRVSVLRQLEYLVNNYLPDNLVVLKQYFYTFLNKNQIETWQYFIDALKYTFLITKLTKGLIHISY